MATRLGCAFYAAGHSILQVWSRSASNAATLARKLGALSADTDFSQLRDDADIYILCVSDDAIAELADRFPFKDKLLVHTSGATALDIIRNGAQHTGVFYPLQTLSKVKDLDFLDIPIGIEGSDERAHACLNKLGATISEKVYPVDSGQRLTLHLAAVVACNFSNHMYALAEGLLQEHQLSFDLLRPLIQETAQKAMFFSPSKVQTGPAARGDAGTLIRHLEMLENNSSLQAIYKLVSDSIIEKYH